MGIVPSSVFKSCQVGIMIPKLPILIWGGEVDKDMCNCHKNLAENFINVQIPGKWPKISFTGIGHLMQHQPMAGRTPNNSEGGGLGVVVGT